MEELIHIVARSYLSFVITRSYLVWDAAGGGFLGCISANPSNPITAVSVPAEWGRPSAIAFTQPDCTGLASEISEDWRGVDLPPWAPGVE